MADPNALPAGGFSSWLRRFRSAQREAGGVDVPCGACTACCTSSYFIHVRPEEAETLARIPSELLFPAPGWPEGHRVLGHDERGHCPMLVEGSCSIYEHRPLTCRRYDCRVFTATGMSAGDSGKTAIDERARRFVFSHPTGDDRAERAAVEAAASFLQTRSDAFPAGFLPGNPTQLAALAIDVHALFLDRGDAKPPPTDAELVRRIVERAS